MLRFCHRCHGELAGNPAESTFCPHCGAPQLRVIEENIAPAVLAANGAPATSGAVPPPHPGRVHWTTVVSLAGLITGVATILGALVFLVPGAFPIAWLWTVCGAAMVLVLYQRRHPETPLSAGLGARIGIVYGLLAATSLTVLVVVAGLIARYSLHRMGAVDAWFAITMHTALEQQMQQLQQNGQAANSPMTPDQMRSLFYSPELRAGLALLIAAVSAVFLLGFSALGGAVGGLLRTRRVPPQA